MDEGLEHAMYQLLRDALPDTVLVSVGHRSSLLPFHTHALELLGEGKWRVETLRALSRRRWPWCCKSRHQSCCPFHDI